jgi:hypothetical protein
LRSCTQIYAICFFRELLGRDGASRGLARAIPAYGGFFLKNPLVICRFDT